MRNIRQVSNKKKQFDKQTMATTFCMEENKRYWQTNGPSEMSQSILLRWEVNNEEHTSMGGGRNPVLQNALDTKNKSYKKKRMFNWNCSFKFKPKKKKKFSIFSQVWRNFFLYKIWQYGVYTAFALKFN